MENKLFEYMNRRVSGNAETADNRQITGPVITISRQAGCGASQVAWELCKKLNERHPQQLQNWKYISREVLQKTAGELNLDPIALKQIVSDNQRGMMDQIIEALSSHTHVSDQKIFKTIENVIRQFGDKGNAVIVGRGGVIICNDIALSLHIRLEAPEEWRIERVAHRFDFSREYAAKYVRKLDAERDTFVKKMQGIKTGIYDVTINCSRFKLPQLVDSIFELARIKKLVE